MKRQKNGRDTAVDILIEISKKGAYGNIALRKTLSESQLDKRDRAFVTELVNGVLRNLILIDYVIDFFSKIKTTKMKPVILAVMRISIYQLYFLHSIPPSAVCNEAVEITKMRGYAGLAGFVNGVLRSVCREKDAVIFPDKVDSVKYLSTIYSYSEWIVERLAAQYGEEQLEGILSAANTAPDVTVCPNTLKQTAVELAELLTSEGMRVSVVGESMNKALHISGTSDITESESYKNGRFHVMDEGSMYAVETLNPQPGETVFDMCAAPGGKTFYAAYRMKDTGKIAAFDLHEHKIRLMKSAASRLGLSCPVFEQRDSSVLDHSLGQADRVLLDAPCSGLGAARKKPEVKYMRGPETIARLVELQRRLLAVAGSCVKPGGVLVYCTCTVFEDENEKNIEWFLKNFPFTLTGQKQLLPGAGSDGFYIAHMKRLETGREGV